jgi:uncharacterized protein YdaU (DUF1376 family)
MAEEKLRPLHYYQWFWQDWRSNRRVQQMSYQARGLYRELLDEYWAEGIIPDDLKALAVICACPLQDMEHYWPEIEPRWIRVDDGFRNEKLEAMRTGKDAERIAKARAGRSGGFVSNSHTRAEAKRQTITESHVGTLEGLPLTLKDASASVTQLQASAEELSARAKHFQAKPDIEEEVGEELELVGHQAKSTSRKTSATNVAARIYDAYPKKVGKNAAMSSIRRAIAKVLAEGVVDPESYLCDCIAAWIESREADKHAGKFVPEFPNPATWFKQGRYEDPASQPKTRTQYTDMTQEQAAALWEKDMGAQALA